MERNCWYCHKPLPLTRLLRRELFCSRDHEDRYFSQQTAAALERMMLTAEPEAPPAPEPPPTKTKVEEEEKQPPPMGEFVKAAGAPFEAVPPETQENEGVDPLTVVAPPATAEWIRLPEPELALGDWIPETLGCRPADSIRQTALAEIVFHGTTAMPWDLHMRSFPADTPNPQPLVAVWSFEAVDCKVESVLAVALAPNLAGASTEFRTELTGAVEACLPAIPPLAPEPLIALWPTGIIGQTVGAFGPDTEVLPAPPRLRIPGAETGARAGLIAPENLPPTAPVMALWSNATRDQTVERFAPEAEVLAAPPRLRIAGVEARDRARPAAPEDLPPTAPIMAVWPVRAIDQAVDSFALADVSPAQVALRIALAEAKAAEDLPPTAAVFGSWSIGPIDQAVDRFEPGDILPAQVALRIASAEAADRAVLAPARDRPPAAPVLESWSIAAVDRTVEPFSPAEVLPAQVTLRIADVAAWDGTRLDLPPAAPVLTSWSIGAISQTAERLVLSDVVPAQITARIAETHLGVRAKLAAAPPQDSPPSPPRMARHAGVGFDLTPCFGESAVRIADLSGAAHTLRFSTCGAIDHFSVPLVQAAAIGRVPQGTWTNPRSREPVFEAIADRRSLRIGTADLRPGFIVRPAGGDIAFSLPAPEELPAKGFTILTGIRGALPAPALEQEQRWFLPGWGAHDSITACRFAPSAVFAAAGPVGMESVWHTHTAEIRDRDRAAGPLFGRAWLEAQAGFGMAWEAAAFAGCGVSPVPSMDLSSEMRWQIGPIDSRRPAPMLELSCLAVLTPVGPSDDPTESRMEPAPANRPRPAQMVIPPEPGRFAEAGGLERQRAIEGGIAFPRLVPARLPAARRQDGWKLADSPAARPLGCAERTAFDFGTPAGADSGGCPEPPARF